VKRHPEVRDMGVEEAIKRALDHSKTSDDLSKLQESTAAQDHMDPTDGAPTVDKASKWKAIRTNMNGGAGGASSKAESPSKGSPSKGRRASMNGGAAINSGVGEEADELFKASAKSVATAIKWKALRAEAESQGEGDYSDGAIAGVSAPDMSSAVGSAVGSAMSSEMGRVEESLLTRLTAKLDECASETDARFDARLAHLSEQVETTQRLLLTVSDALRAKSASKSRAEPSVRQKPRPAHRESNGNLAAAPAAATVALNGGVISARAGGPAADPMAC